MKCGTTASIFTFPYLRELCDELHGRLTLSALSDEETFGPYGARYLFEHHPEEASGQANYTTRRGRPQSKSSACLCPAAADYALSMFDLGRTFLAAVERSPDAIAIVDGEQRLGYAAWYEEIARVAGGLTALGLSRGDRLAVILQNRLEMASLHWACQFVGIVVTPLNWRIKAEELDYCLADADAGAIVFDDVAADTVAGAVAAQRLPRIAIGNVDGATCRFEDLARRRERVRAASRARGSVAAALHLGHDRAAEGRAAPAPRRARRRPRPCRAEPVRPRRAHARCHAALPHDGRALAAGDGARRRDLRLPAALRRSERRCG